MRKQLAALALTAVLATPPLTGCSPHTATVHNAEGTTHSTSSAPSSTTPISFNDSKSTNDEKSGSDKDKADRKKSGDKKTSKTDKKKSDGKKGNTNKNNDPNNTDKHPDAHKHANNKTPQKRAQQPSTGHPAMQSKTIETHAAAPQAPDNNGSTYQPDDIQPGETPTMQRHMHLKPEDIDPDVANYTGPTQGVTNVTEGAYCTNYGAGSTGTTADNKNMLCIVLQGEENPQWVPFQ